VGLAERDPAAGGTAGRVASLRKRFKRGVLAVFCNIAKNFSSICRKFAVN
jgi:hypothetical protein